MTSRRAVALLAAVTGLLTAGCAGVPGRSPVVPANRVEAPPVKLFAAPPTSGDTPEGIVEGFLDAGRDFNQNHRVAREYLERGGPQWQALAPAPAAEGQQAAPVVVVEGEPCLRLVAVDGAPLTGPAGSRTSCAATGSERVDRAEASALKPRDGQTATVLGTARIRARIDQFGRFALSGGTYRQEFDLVGRGGEWRIRDAPAGLVLTPSALGVTFAPLPLYFAARAGDQPGPGGAAVPGSAGPAEEPRVGEWLVPDVRWFPTALERSSTAAMAVRALLAGPSGWLADAVTSGGEPGVELAPLAGVQLDEVGSARVDLTVAPARRRLLHAQLLATLRGLPNGPPVTDVGITVQQVRLDIPAGPVPALWTPPAVAEPGSPLCLTAKGQVGRIHVTDEPVCAARADLEPLTRRAPNPALPAGDVRGSLFAVLSRQRDAVWAMTPGQPEPAAVVRGLQLTAPSLDGTGPPGKGWVWAASGVPGGPLLAGALGKRRQVAVDVPWQGTGRILAVRISPEGSRALIVLTRGTRTEVVVSGVVRAADGTPRRLSDSRLSLLPDLTSAVDAVWRDTEQVAVLGVRAGRPETSVWSVEVGGNAFELVDAPFPADQRAEGLAAGGSVDVFVRTGVRTRVSPPRNWPLIDVRAPVMPG